MIYNQKMIAILLTYDVERPLSAWIDDNRVHGKLPRWNC